MSSSIGLAFGSEDVCVVSEAVEERRGQPFVAEDLDPLGERELGGDDRRAAFVAVSEQVGEHLAAGSLEGHEAEFLDH